MIVVTTPNQRSLVSLGALLLKGHFSAFGARNYPAHQTALLDIDLSRIAANDLREVAVEFTGVGECRCPACDIRGCCRGCFRRALSDNVLLITRAGAGDHANHLPERLGSTRRLEVALAGMVTALERLRPDWQFQVVLPGDGPLRDRLNETRATCSVVPMPAALSRLGEWAAVQDGWRASSQVALGIKLCGTAGLPAESRLGRAISNFHPDVIHTNGLKAHVLGARLRRPDASLVWHLHEYISPRKLTGWLLRRYASRCSAIVANSASVARASPRASVPCLMFMSCRTRLIWMSSLRLVGGSTWIGWPAYLPQRHTRRE